MPYIPQEDRIRATTTPRTSGELNYALTRVAIWYLGENGVRYESMNDIVGAFENAKLEFVRRVLAPYEDAKRRENGDVFL